MCAVQVQQNIADIDAQLSQKKYPACSILLNFCPRLLISGSPLPNFYFISHNSGSKLLISGSLFFYVLNLVLFTQDWFLFTELWTYFTEFQFYFTEL